MNLQVQAKTRAFLITIGLMLAITLQTVFAQAQDKDPYLGIIPAPVSVTKSAGTFSFSNSTAIKADNLNDKAVVFLKDYLSGNRNLTNKWAVYSSKKAVKSGTVVLTSVGAENLPAEGYKLSITPGKIMVIGKDAGLFYGIQTLLQLFPVENTAVAKIPCAEIVDQPRFGYRGMMLDVSRHFFTVEQVKKVIDLIASYKINTFHWHLVDGQGWRIEIKKYPKLTEVGGTRLLTNFGGNRDYLDQLPYTGFYTQEQIRDVVNYAANKYINIVPEIEMPAHSDAALRAYPELKCIPMPGTNPGNGIYCPTEETFAFLEGVMTEVIALFPSKYIHIGGDEAGKGPWIGSQYVQDLKKRLNLKDENEVQSYFISRMEKFINSKGRSIIGWDEILQGGLAPNATVMSWQGEQGGIAAAQQHHNVIMTPQTNGMYLDHYQSASPQEPVSFGRYATLQETYNYDPVSKVLTADERKYVIGTQGNLWTEYVPTFAKLQYQILPRIFAISEVAWSKVENKNYTEFSENRLAKHFAKLDAIGFNYRVPTALNELDTFAIGAQFTWAPKSVIPGARIYYTLNGRNPFDTDWEYTTPLIFMVPPNERRELRTTVVTPSGRRSISTRVVMYNRQPMPAVSYAGNTAGLSYKLIMGKFTSPAQLDDASLSSTKGIAPNLATDQFKAANPNFGIVYEGYIKVPTDGTYKIALSSYTDAALTIDDQRVVELEEPTPLLKGYHKFKLNYIYNAPPAPAVQPGGGGGRGGARPSVLRVFLSEPGATGPRKDIDAAILFN